MLHPELTQPSHLASGVADTTAPSPPNAPAKKGETIEDLIERLPPHGKQDCVTHTRKDETIEKAISRIPTSEGLYKLFCMLTQKDMNVDLDTGHQEMINRKAHAAVDKAMHLLATKLNQRKYFLEHTVANSIAEHGKISAIKSEVAIEDCRRLGSTTIPSMLSSSTVWQLPEPGTVIHLIQHRLRGEDPKTI
jgi:hypothetical protein